MNLTEIYKQALAITKRFLPGEHRVFVQGIAYKNNNEEFVHLYTIQVYGSSSYLKSLANSTAATPEQALENFEKELKRVLPTA